ncbi:MAG: cysteine hydrolase family protein, partial [Bacillota bacterium]
MGSRVLLVVDMLEDFINPAGSLYCGPAAGAIVPFVEGKIREVLGDGGSVVFICDSHDRNDAEFARFPTHCVRGTPGAEIIAPLRVAPADPSRVSIVRKTRYS